jgi:GH15 family glucan-1,4-alpha-glucosidase
VTARTNGFAPLREYFATGDGRSVALIASDGSIDWWAVPELDCPPTFGALLDPSGGGTFSLTPAHAFSAQQRYVGKTNVVETLFTTDSGTVRVTDSLNSGIAGRLPWAELGRRVEGLTGTVAMQWEVQPGTALGTASPWVSTDRSEPLLHVGDVTMAVIRSAVGRARTTEKGMRGEFATSPGSRGLLGVVGTANEPLFIPAAEVVDARIDRTIASWEDWSNALRWDGPFPDAVLRSALALKLLLFSPTGAIAAAATTSLPERVGGSKNWDYRFSWIRDTAYTVDAFVRAGLTEETHAALSWMLAAAARHRPGLQPFYTLDGRRPDRKAVRDIPGYAGSQPVVDGNDATDQHQLGPYGDLFQSVLLSVQAGHNLEGTSRRLLAELADRCCDLWRSRDAGMWELPDEQHYTVSKMSAWQALDRAVTLQEMGQLPGDVDRWRHEAEQVREWVHERCWSAEQGAYVMHAGSDRLDAGVLLAARIGFDRGERIRSTISALQQALGAGPWMYRYTGMREAEGAFIACSFWLVEALALSGQAGEGHVLMKELIEAFAGLGLMTEMIDPTSGDLLGNMPQALSHLALINAASALAGDD